MKIFKIITLAILLLCIPVVSFGAGSCTQAGETVGTNSGMKTITFTCTADASNGSFPATNLSTDNTTFISGYYLIMAVTKPGSPAPTNLWGATVTSANGTDVMGGNMASQSSSLNKQQVPQIGTVYGPRPINSALTLNITGNSVNSAVITVLLYFSR
jgi:hypothetical protein